MKPDAFYSNHYLHYKQVCKIHLAIWNILNEKTRDDAIQVCELSLGHVSLISSTVSKTTLIKGVIF